MNLNFDASSRAYLNLLSLIYNYYKYTTRSLIMGISDVAGYLWVVGTLELLDGEQFTSFFQT